MSAQVKTMDIYVRMSNDCEKDYCFNVPSDSNVSWLFKIFDTLPMVLSPSYFYNPRPIGFSVSEAPGWLTCGGALLFGDNADAPKNLRELDLDKTLRSSVWPGQLVLPTWEFNYRRWLGVIGALAAWLYLDLPDCVSPTPGHQPTVLLFALIEHFFPSLKESSVAKSASGGGSFDSVYWQWGFFSLHVLKVLFIYLLFYVGGINPISLYWAKARKWKESSDITREDLVSIGWTSARRATPTEWREEYRKQQIEAEGGIVQAYHAGTLDKLKEDPGLFELDEGEGWATVKPAGGDGGGSDDAEGKQRDSVTLDDLKEQTTVTVSDVYTEQYYQPLVNVLFGDKKLDSVESAQQLKEFRRIGPLPPNVSAVLAELYQRRRQTVPESKKGK